MADCQVAPQLGIEIKQLQADLQRFVSGYKDFLTLATVPESSAIPPEVQPFINELLPLEKQGIVGQST
ncbi:hypothetical protein [Endozoicomonas sp. GU-1]|uniref:hypothetical protein n=1 Tax=Endozoicomonas sp. GU-1 TaxID=3009078 RepID=UPI0022B3BC4E|nr:hypothetical protein [Endozoicomonas sp. GU-1]WBA82240.1 hypothetical protein O2T12_03515 [Endozoicomonas sp. GU-1]